MSKRKEFKCGDVSVILENEERPDEGYELWVGDSFVVIKGENMVDLANALQMAMLNHYTKFGGL